MRHSIPCLPAVLLLVASACGEPVAEPTEGTRVRIVETYGDDAARSVTLTAMFSTGTTGAIEVSDVHVDVSPGEALLVQKLEMVLQDAAFQWSRAPGDWPTLVRPLPPEALPMVRRLQLALLLLDGPPNFQVDCSNTDLLSHYPSLGLTRVSRDASTVTLASLGVAMTPTGSSLVWGHATGEVMGGTVELQGTRRLGLQSPEKVTTTVARIVPSSPTSPAGR